MNRSPSTTTSDQPFSQPVLEAVWAKAVIVPGHSPAKIRKDSCGAWMKRTEYGTQKDFGWEIDHIQPVSLNGSDELLNLQPLHWRNNRGKGDDYPNWACTVTGDAKP